MQPTFFRHSSTSQRVVPCWARQWVYGFKTYSISHPSCRRIRRCGSWTSFCGCLTCNDESFYRAMFWNCILHETWKARYQKDLIDSPGLLEWWYVEVFRWHCLSERAKHMSPMNIHQSIAKSVTCSRNCFNSDRRKNLQSIWKTLNITEATFH